MRRPSADAVAGNGLRPAPTQSRQWHLLHSHWPALSTTRHSKQPCSPGCVVPWRLPDSGRHSASTGSVWTASCCPGPPKLRPCCASNTLQLGVPRGRVGRSDGRVGAIGDACRLRRDVPPAPLPRTHRHGGRLCRGVSPLLLGGALFDDLKLAPFHVLATEGMVQVQHDHVWHLETLASLCRAALQPDPGVSQGSPLLATTYTLVDVTDSASQHAGTLWWEDVTSGGEGMVVKPLDCIVRGRRGLVQPAVKCRGREYLRIIYGPSTLPQLISHGYAPAVGS